MRTFLQRYGNKILGVLSGFDWIRFRGSLRKLMYEAGVASWLSDARLLFKDFTSLAEGLTKNLRQRVEVLAKDADRPVSYLPSKVDKEDLVQRLRDERSAAANGLVAVLSTLESCQTYHVYRNAKTHHLDLRRRAGKCLHYYVYLEDPSFGLTQVRLMTWFPFNCHVLLNGREWLARQLDRKQVGYLRRDNCFVQIEDFDQAQRLAALQPKINWTNELDRVLRFADPQAGRLVGDTTESYYWTSEQTEWATDVAFRDVAFRDVAALVELYPQLTRHAITTFQSPDVMRFLGHKLPGHGGLHGKYAGEIVSDLKRRPEGVRVKHRAGRNSVKMYDKFGSVLRIETTLNDPQGLKVLRAKSDAPEGSKEWLPLRKSVADLSRRTELSQASNERYLEALGQVDVNAPLSSLTDKLCRPVEVKCVAADGTARIRRHRALRPFDPDEVRLLQTISRGEYEIAGFRNRDVRAALFDGPCQVLADENATAPTHRRQETNRVGRLFAMLRAHGIIKKFPRSHRYLLTTSGRIAIAAILAAREASPQKLAA